jgi:hypothetical protein
MVFVVIGAIVVGLTGVGVIADSLARRRRGAAGKGRWADDQTHAQFDADSAAKRAKPPSGSNSQWS